MPFRGWSIFCVWILFVVSLTFSRHAGGAVPPPTAKLETPPAADEMGSETDLAQDGDFAKVFLWAWGMEKTLEVQAKTIEKEGFHQVVDNFCLGLGILSIQTAGLLSSRVHFYRYRPPWESQSNRNPPNKKQIIVF